MNARSVLSGLFCAILIGGLAACATEDASMKSSDTGSTPRATGTSTAGTSTTAGNPVPKSLDALSDSLNTCLSRIPKDSSSGARMMAENSCRRDEAIRTGTAGSNDRVSAGAQDDTLQACMGRIPKEATAGQRMLAEESCKRDEAARK
jgi:hypothetical protein